MGHVIRPRLVTAKPRESRWVNSIGNPIEVMLTENVVRREGGGAPLSTQRHPENLVV
jgi:hypothetical protein